MSKPGDAITDPRPSVATGAKRGPSFGGRNALTRASLCSERGCRARVTDDAVVYRFTLTLQSNPGGMQLVVNQSQSTATFTRTVIVGSRNTVSAVSPQSKGSKSYRFDSWSDGGAQTHDIVAPATATTYTARFRR